MIWYYLLAVVGQTVEGFAGFGSTALIMPFVAMAIGTRSAVALLSINSLVSGSILAISQLKKVNLKEYLKIVLCVAPIVPLGILAFSALSPYESALKLIFGLVMVYVGGRNAYFYFIKKAEPPRLGEAGQYIALATGAVVQGMFTCGGPLIALYASVKLEDKGSFRATMSAMWCTVNIEALILRLLFTDMYDAAAFKAALWCVPSVVAGILIGMAIHKRVDNTFFRKLVYVILFIGGALSVVSCVASMLR